MALLSWSDAAQYQLEGGAPKAAVFLRLATSPEPVRVWGGIGDFPLPADLIETTDQALYAGFGELANLPVVQALINGEAERVEFTMGGAWLSGETLRLAGRHAADIRQAVANLGLLVLGSDLQPISPVAWLWAGVADSLSVHRDDDGQSGAQRTIVLSVGSAFTGRRRSASETMTGPNQRLRSADDAFCDNTASYNEGTTRVWPR